MELKDVVVKLRLSTLKPHAGWVIDFYNEMTSSKGVELVKSGWRTSGLQDAVSLGLGKLPPVDPFEELEIFMLGPSAKVYPREMHKISRICHSAKVSPRESFYT